MKIIMKEGCPVGENLRRWVEFNSYNFLDVLTVPPHEGVALSAGAEKLPCLVKDSGEVIYEPQLIKLYVAQYYSDDEGGV